MSGSITPFGHVAGVPVDLYTLVAANGTRAAITPFGARLVQLWVADRVGVLGDVTLGFDRAEDYIGSYFGATCGRYGNRIAGARFVLEGRDVVLDANEGVNHLHGGRDGFDGKIWQVVSQDSTHITMRADSTDGEMGYPGNLTLFCTYRFEGAALRIEMQATTDAVTVVNMVNHAYVNLGCGGDILGHILQVDAPQYTPVTDDLLTTGEVRSVAGTGFDFTMPRAIGGAMAGHAELAKGYDHNWCLSGDDGPAMVVTDPVSGRRMRLHTNQKGVQIYTFGQQDGLVMGKGGADYGRFAGLTFETQTYPCAPNHAHFPSAILRPDQTYDHWMELRFDTV